MITSADTVKTSVGQTQPDWYDRITKAGLLVVGILNLVQDRASWFPYVFLFVLLLLSYPVVSRKFAGWRVQRRQRAALRTFATDFKAHLVQAGKFTSNSDSYSIPWAILQVQNQVAGLNPETGGPRLAQALQSRSGIGTLCDSILRFLLQWAERRMTSYDDFNALSRAFSDLFSSFIWLLVDEVIRELKRGRYEDKLQPYLITDLKRRYEAVSRFVDDYNQFRIRVTGFCKDSGSALTINPPNEVLD